MRASVTGDSPSVEPLPRGQSLVPVPERAAAEAGSRRLRPSAPFLAHLIAAAQGAPQARARRRTAAGDATTIYMVTAERRPPPRHRLARLV
jgi:hypothetical protein